MTSPSVVKKEVKKNPPFVYYIFLKDTLNKHIDFCVKNTVIPILNHKIIFSLFSKVK